MSISTTKRHTINEHVSICPKCSGKLFRLARYMYKCNDCKSIYKMIDIVGYSNNIIIEEIERSLKDGL